MTNEKILKKVVEKAEWKPCIGFENKYLISNDGKVMNRKRLNILRSAINPNGYRYVTFYIGNYRTVKKKIHRLLIKSFLPNPMQLPMTNHKDGNKLNNHIANLEWCSASYNVVDGFNRGRIQWNKGKTSIKPKVCPNCQMEFMPARNRVKSCSYSCSSKIRKRNEKGQLI